jgi:hypothetical protein
MICSPSRSTGHDGQPKQRRFMTIARSGHGPYIPCMPAILLARRLAKREVPQRGSLACVCLINLDDHVAELGGLDISIIRDTTNA